MMQLYYAFKAIVNFGGNNLIKIISLSLGLLIGLLLFSRVAYEASFDNFYQDVDNLYLVKNKYIIGGEGYSPVLIDGQTLCRNILNLRLTEITPENLKALVDKLVELYPNDEMGLTILKFGCLSRRDSTLLTVGFSLRTSKPPPTFTPQG
jgi:hypothetical protein